MPSTNKTEFLNLSQYLPGDKFRFEDLTRDFATLDAFLKQLSGTSDSVLASLLYRTITPERLTAIDAGRLSLVDSAGKMVELTEADLDIGSAFEDGRDYYVFKDEVGQYGVTATKNKAGVHAVGGFHYGRNRRINRALQPVNSSAVVRGSGWIPNVYSGIVSRSVWDVTHRPKCDPEGMVYLGAGTWVDIYLSSDDLAGGLASKLHATPLSGAEGLNWYSFVEAAAVVNKRLLSYEEFCQAAIGSPPGKGDSNDNAWTMTTNTGRVPTGHVFNAVSSVGCVDCVGNLWEWTNSMVTRVGDRLAGGGFGATDGARAGKEIPVQASYGNGHHNNIAVTSGFMPAGRWAWDAISPFGDDFGNIYEYYDYSLNALVAGGDWYSGAHAGSRTVRLNIHPWHVHSGYGARCASESL